VVFLLRSFERIPDRPCRYLELLEELLNALPEQTEDRKDLVPVYLSGNMAHSESYFSLIEDAGAMVVQDDLCCGARTLRLMVQEDVDPIEALTQRYFTSFFCPTKHKGTRAHEETLLREVQESGARGVIFLLYKYCEAHYFDYPDLRAALESKGSLACFWTWRTRLNPWAVKDSSSGLCGNAFRLRQCQMSKLNFK